MSIRIIIAGESKCSAFAECCVVADYLQLSLPTFCYDSVEKPVNEWKMWLYKINQKYKWHHLSSPIIWKEMLTKGSKPYYIGGLSEFLDYCFSYYNFDGLFATSNNEALLKSISQYKKKLTADRTTPDFSGKPEKASMQNSFVVAISGAGHYLAMHLISKLLEMANGEKHISKIYLHDSKCSQKFMESVERQCGYVESFSSNKIVKYVEKIGLALTYTDVLIILDHVPFDENMPIGEWLKLNKSKMKKLSVKINASASRKMYIIFANLGPACYNATILRKYLNIPKQNIVVATSDLGLEIVPTLAEYVKMPMRNIFCPPVWGFVGINHLVDIRTTVHLYTSFQPYNRYTKVKKSTLNIGSVTPEMRVMEYLTFFDEVSFWTEVAELKSAYQAGEPSFNKAEAVIGLINQWLLNPNSDAIVNLGIHCDGSFGLTFDGIFSQPARLVNGTWVPAKDYFLPRDKQMKLPYLQKMAEYVLSLEENDLPKIVDLWPCTCKVKFYKKKGVW